MTGTGRHCSWSACEYCSCEGLVAVTILCPFPFFFFLEGVGNVAFTVWRALWLSLLWENSGCHYSDVMGGGVLFGIFVVGTKSVCPILDDDPHIYQDRRLLPFFVSVAVPWRGETTLIHTKLVQASSLRSPLNVLSDMSENFIACDSVTYSNPPRSELLSPMTEISFYTWNLLFTAMGVDCACR